MTAGRFRVVRAGTPEELEPLESDETWIRVQAVVNDDVHRRIGELLASRPDVELHLEDGEDLEALRWYPNLRRLGARSLRLRSLDGLRHVAGSLEWLILGETLTLRSLRPVASLSRLTRLAVNGSWKDLDSIASLSGLERLAIGSIDLELLLPLVNLRRFESGLGTIRSLELLPEVGQLELVELYRLRGEHDLTPLARIPTLRYLLLESTRSITTLPSFGASPALGWVKLSEMRGITDIRPVAAARRLEVLMLIGMCQLAVKDLRPLVGHPSLRAGIWGLCSERKNRAAQALLPLPPSESEPAPWIGSEWSGIRDPAET